MRHRHLLTLTLLAAGLGCSSFDARTVPVSRGTLGEEVVRVFCERMAAEANPTDVTGTRWKPVCRGQHPVPSDAPPRLRVLLDNRERIAGAIDRVMPETVHDELGVFLGELMPLYDLPRERFPRNTRLLAQFVDALSQDRDALEALSRLGSREGYQPRQVALGLARPLLSYPDFDRFAETALRVISDLEEDPDDGFAAPEFRALQHALALQMAASEPGEPLPDGEVGTLELARDLLFQTDALFSNGAPIWTVARDPRGLALPRGGWIDAPFADEDGDGLADVDPESRRFVDSTGTVITDLPSPFAVPGEDGVPRDASGRALYRDASRVWEYLDLDGTLLAAILRELEPLVRGDSPALLQMARGVPAMWGPDTTLEETFGQAYLAYEGPETSAGSLFDVVYALADLLHREEVARLLELAEVLIRDHESEVAGVLASAESMIDRGDAYPDALLWQPNSFWDDVIELGIEYAQDPELLEAVLRSFADPRTARLGHIFGQLMRYRDPVTYDPRDPNGEPLTLPLGIPVDRGAPDERFNESLFQRSIALIDGFDGVQVCNRDGAVIRLDVFGLEVRYPLIGGAAECELIRIDNVDEAYALAMLGEYELELQDDFLNFMVDAADDIGINVDDLLEASSGIDGLTRHPTPQALSRLVFWALDTDPETGLPNSRFAADLLDPIVDRHGNDVISTHFGTIFAWEMPGFFEGMAPLLGVLHDPRWRYSAEGRYRFGQFISTIHRHWATPQHWYTQSAYPNEPNFSYQDDGRSYEELIADGLIDAELLERVQALAAATESIEIDGRDGMQIFAEGVAVLIDPERSDTLATRDGRGAVLSNDGSHEMDATPLVVLLDALAAVDRDLDAAPERRDAWKAGRGALARQLLGADSFGDDLFAFRNPRARGILMYVIPFLLGRIAEHRDRGDLQSWTLELVDDIESGVRSPVLAGAFLFLDRLQEDPDAQRELTLLLHALLDESADDAFFETTLTSAASLLMTLDDDENSVPIARAMSRAIAPDAPEVVAGTDTEIDLDGSVVGDTLTMLREIQRADIGGTLPRVLANLVGDPGEARDAVAPIEDLLDAIAEINRVVPGEQGAFTADDYEVMLGIVRDVIRDEDRGLERLNRIFQDREID